MKLKYNLTILTTLGMLLTIIGIFFYYKTVHSKNISQQKIISTVTDSTSLNNSTITALGYIQPKNGIIKLAGPSHLFNGRIVDLKVKEGDIVQKGQIIATLDSLETQQTSLKIAQRNVALQTAKIEQIKAGEAKIGEINSQIALIKNLEAEFSGQVAIQKSRIAHLEADFLRQKEAQDAKINRLKAELNNAQIECSRYETLLKNGAVNTSIRDSKCLVAKTNEETLKEAEANKNRIANTLEKELQEARLTLTKILATFPQQISQAKSTLEKLQEVRSVDLKVAQTELQEILAKVSEAEAELELAYIRSPIKGEVLKVNTFPGEKINEEGIVDLAQTDTMYVVTEVYETDINQVHINSTAIIKSSALSKNLTGKVIEIGNQIDKKDIFNSDPTLSVDARVFKVKIELDKASANEAKKFINLEVEVEINTNS
jgi:ABC exporter DevB family membrane fusion protein